MQVPTGWRRAGSADVLAVRRVPVGTPAPVLFRQTLRRSPRFDGPASPVARHQCGQHAGVNIEDGDAVLVFSYEERYRWTAGDPANILFSVVGLAFGVRLLQEGLVLGLLPALPGGLALLLRASQLASQRVMLQVDQIGVTLGSSPPWPRRSAAVVPWADVLAVVLWRSRTGRRRCVGLERREGSQVLPGSSSGAVSRRRAIAFVRLGEQPPSTVHVFRVVSGWSVDSGRLTRAVNDFAPHVRVDVHW